MADAMVVFLDVVKSLFGCRVIRASCFFHICQGARRWMVKEGFGHVVRGYVDSVLRHLSLAESPVKSMFKLHMYQLATREHASEGSD